MSLTARCRAISTPARSTNCRDDQRHAVEIALPRNCTAGRATGECLAGYAGPGTFWRITRTGDLPTVLAGIEAARAAGFERLKINAVILKNLNEEEIPSLMQWAHGKGMALTLIEVMPMGDIGEGRIDQYVPLSLLRARLAQQFTLTDLADDTGGPARYVSVAETGGKLGFITPMTHNFCEVHATGCASPAPARCIPASATRMPPICASRCGLPPTTTCSPPRSTAPSA